MPDYKGFLPDEHTMKNSDFFVNPVTQIGIIFVFKNSIFNINL